MGLKIMDEFWLCRKCKVVSYRNLIALYSELETEAAGKPSELIAFHKACQYIKHLQYGRVLRPCSLRKRNSNFREFNSIHFIHVP
jgi:hypothetical protein